MKKKKQKTTDSVAYKGVIPRTPIRFLMHITKQHPWPAAIAIVAVAVGQVLALFEIFAISKLVDSFAAAETRADQLDTLLYWGSIFLALLVASKIMWRISGFAGISWIVKTVSGSYKELYGYIVGHSHGYFTDRFAGALSNKISNAADGTARLVDRTLWSAWPELIALFATFTFFFAIHWSMGLLVVVMVIAVLLFNVWRVKHRRPYVIAFAAASSKIRGEGVDLLTNVTAMRQYSQHATELARIGEAADDRAAKDLKQWYMGEWTMVVNTSLGALMMLMALVLVYMLLSLGHATAGNLVLVLMLLARLTHTFNVFGMVMNSFIRMYGEVEEGLDEVLLSHEIADSASARKLKTNGGKIEWSDVVFEFTGNKVFNKFNLNIEPGQRVGLVGPSGAGKTTFVSLLLRQHDIDSGTIEIDGQNIADITQDSLRENIAVVPQEPLLFHRTIRENIAYGNPKATQKEIEAVAKKAQAHQFIMDLPEGYKTLVGERGIKLSGGQKQRVAIARAMLKNAPILVLDEATSALDSESEVLIQKALEKLMEGKTVIAVAHRLSTLRKMDRILVLEKGKIREDGTHDELTQSGGTYQRLWEHQAGGFLQD